MSDEVKRLEELLKRANQGFWESDSALMQVAWWEEAKRVRAELAKARRRESNNVMSTPCSESA